MNTQLPFPTALYALASFYSLFLISGHTLWFLVALGVALLGSYVLRLRLPVTWLPSLLLAGLLISLAIMLTPPDGPGMPAMIGGARAGFLSGQTAAILVLIQFYRPVPLDPVRPRLFALSGSTFLLLISCNTYDENSLHGLTPFLILLGGLSLRSGRQRQRATALAVVLIGLAFLLTSALSFGGVKVVQDRREQLLEWGNRLLGERPLQEVGGMSQQPILGARFGLRGSALRVLKLEGSLQSTHLRGISYDTYADGRWWPVVTSRGFQSVEEVRLEPARARQTLGRLRSIKVTRLVSDNPYLYLPLSSVELSLDSQEGAEWAPQEGGPVRVRVGAPYSYTYKEGEEGVQGLLARPLLESDPLLQKHLALPKDLDPALATLARQITAGATTAENKIAQVTNYLLQTYPYSLTFHPGTGDPVVSFLREGKKEGAHCELFASAAALLLRSVGVPTRYVTGYFAHEGHVDGTTLVRQRDAHAWCEAWVPAKGWVTVEATPPTGWPEQDKTPVELWRRLWEAFQDRWLALSAWLGEQEPGPLVAIFFAPVGGILLLYLWRRRRASEAIPPETWHHPPTSLQPFVARFEAALKRAGYVLERQQPWSELAPALPEPLRSAVDQFLRLYLPQRFSTSLAPLAALEDAVKAVEAAARNPVPRPKEKP